MLVCGNTSWENASIAWVTSDVILHILKENNSRGIHSKHEELNLKNISAFNCNKAIQYVVNGFVTTVFHCWLWLIKSAYSCKRFKYWKTMECKLGTKYVLQSLDKYKSLGLCSRSKQEEVFYFLNNPLVMLGKKRLLEYNCSVIHNEINLIGLKKLVTSPHCIM